MPKKSYTKIAMWLLNMDCNFQCPYCFYDDGQRSLKQKLQLKMLDLFPSKNLYKTRFITPEKAKQFFDATGHRWLIVLSGGEPFVYPKFVELVEALGEKHQMIIGTNLSLPIDKFLEKIKPGMIHSFYASLHLGERERQHLSVDDFLEKAVRLTKAGFKVEIDYVMYPELIPRFLEIHERFKKEGLFVEAKDFRGMYGGKKYPESYTQEERDFFSKYTPSEVDRAASFKDLSFTGVPCSAGFDLVRIFANGVITRCPHDRENLGNLFSGKLKLHKTVKPCVVPNCKCTLAIKEKCVDFEKRK